MEEREGGRESEGGRGGYRERVWEAEREGERAVLAGLDPAPSATRCTTRVWDPQLLKMK